MAKTSMMRRTVNAIVLTLSIAAWLPVLGSAQVSKDEAERYFKESEKLFGSGNAERGASASDDARLVVEYCEFPAKDCRPKAGTGARLIEMSKVDDPEAQEAWTMWKTRLEDQIATRLGGIARTTLRQSPELGLVAEFRVTKSGKIQNVRVLQRSSSIIFNTLLPTVISSFKDDSVLRFPENSPRDHQDLTLSFILKRDLGGQGCHGLVREKLYANQ